MISNNANLTLERNACEWENISLTRATSCHVFQGTKVFLLLVWKVRRRARKEKKDEDVRDSRRKKVKKAYRCPWTPFVGSPGCTWPLQNGVRIASGVFLL